MLEYQREFEQKEKLILFIIQNYRPKFVLNLGSEVACSMILKYGKPISSLTNLYSYLFLSDRKEHEKKYIFELDYFRNTMLFYTTFFVPNEKLKEKLVNLCGLNNKLADKIKIFS